MIHPPGIRWKIDLYSSHSCDLCECAAVRTQSCYQIIMLTLITTKNIRNKYMVQQTEKGIIDT